MGFIVESLTFLEIFQMLEILLDEYIHLHIDLAQVKSGSQLEEC